MNVLLIGSGGREHALAWAFLKSPLLSTLYVTPGNAGILDIATFADIDVSDHQAVIDFCFSFAINLVVIGPEAPLVAGLADDLRAAGIRTFGPSKAAAQLEGSKGFTKDLCKEFSIPTAAYARFDNAADANAYLMRVGAPIVVKADGLAAGKGVIMAETTAEATQAINDCFSGTFGGAGAEVVLEETLYGEEASFFAITDGSTVLPLATAQDHKRQLDGDKGPNTGGMGAYSPAPIMTEALCEQVMAEIIQPTVDAMAARGTPYQGVLYAGLMMTEKGPELIEYNCRFGDPECQVLMMRLESDILEILNAAAKGELSGVEAKWRDDVALTVVMASDGYPAAYDKGTPIESLPESDEKQQFFHAGTAMDGDQLVAIGGRVLNVTALGKNVSEAQANAYAAVDQVKWVNGFCRRDIGWRAVGR